MENNFGNAGQLVRVTLQFEPDRKADMASKLDIDDLAHRVGDRLRAMEATNEPPYAEEPMPMKRGDLVIILKAMHLLEAVRWAND